jgi:hypothetical protein
MKRIVPVVALLTLAFAAGIAAANKFGQPKSVVHIVTVQWKADSTPEQRNAAVEGVRKMAGEIPGVKNVWLKTVKVQGDANAVMVMEFADQQAFDAYAKSPAHAAWEKVYFPVREHSITFDASN